MWAIRLSSDCGFDLAKYLELNRLLQYRKRRVLGGSLRLVEFARFRALPVLPCGSGKCNPGPSGRCRSAPPPRPHRARITPDSVSLRIPARVAADAGSQPIPHRPITALASAISCSVTFSTTPSRRLDFVQRLGPGDRVADLDGGRERLRMFHRLQRATVRRLHQLVERRRAFGLHHRQPRQPVDQARGRAFRAAPCRRPTYCRDCRPAAPPNPAPASRAGPSSRP